METTIKINTDALSLDIIDSIKKMFPHKVVEITVQEADTTEYILSNENYALELNERINDYEKTKKTIDLKSDEII